MAMALSIATKFVKNNNSLDAREKTNTASYTSTRTHALTNTQTHAFTNAQAHGLKLPQAHGGLSYSTTNEFQDGTRKKTMIEWIVGH